ncbi:MAG: transcriptional repressor [Acidimicrobiia bacterium]|nr:transcriptional repressor [Acidimicrobiia bacterium]
MSPLRMSGSVPTSPELIAQEMHRRIRAAGLRITNQRRAICEVLARNGEAFLTVEEILTAAADLAGGIDPSTCHRTLNDLAEVGVVHHIHFGAQPGRWHLTLDHTHQHLACETCGTMTLVPAGRFEGIFAMLRSEYDFHISMHHFAILGQCGRCRSIDRHSDD